MWRWITTDKPLWRSGIPMLRHHLDDKDGVEIHSHRAANHFTWPEHRGVRMFREDYQHLPAWQRSMDLSVRIYRLTALFPDEEKSGLTASLKRAVTAIPAKIADAAERTDSKDAAKVFGAVAGGLREIDTTLLLCVRLKIVTNWKVQSIRRLIRKLQAEIADETSACDDAIDPTRLAA